jgi:hypothetical protein
MLRGSLIFAAALISGVGAQYPCSSTIPGAWKYESESYNATWNATGGPGGFSFVYLPSQGGSPRKMWSHMYGNFAAGNTTAVAYFDNGHVGHGNVSANCASIHWDDGTTWTAQLPPQYAQYQVHLCPHTHDDVG